MKNKIIWIAGGVVVVAAVVAGLSAESGSNKAYGEVSIGGPALPGHDPAYADPAVVDPAIGMPAPSIAGETVAVSPGNRPTIVLFLAHWCSHCQAEVPRLADWVTENGSPDGVDVIGVATASSPSQGNFPPSAWLEREQFPFPVIYDDEVGTAAEAYGLSAFPFWTVIDSDGNVSGRFSGELAGQGVLTDFFTEVAGL